MGTVAGMVVVVDDEPDVLELICSVLEDEGIDVLCLDHPRRAEELHGLDIQPRLFVLDIMLPTISGIELATRLRSDGFKTTPMVAMSASPTMLQRAKQSELFSAVLGKPFDLDTLVSTVGQHLTTG